MAVVSDFTALISGNSWNGMTDPGAPVFVTYSFMENSEVPSLADYQPFTNDGYTAFNAQQRTNFILATQEFEQVSGIKFIEVDDPANASIKVMNTSGSAWGGWAGGAAATDWYSSNIYLIIDNASTTYAPGTYGFETILHELGHATGLKHPFDGDPTLISSMDNENNTLMSYTSNAINDTALAPLDVNALSYLYGDNSAINSSWSWSWSDASSSFSLTGAAGNDTLIAVDAASAIYGLAGDDVLFGRDGDDKLYGGAGNDILGGGSGNNELYGEGGNDRFLVASWSGGSTIFNGGSGIDTLDYSSRTWSAYVYLDDGTPGSSIIDIENLIGGSADDRLYGNAQANRIDGGAGDDELGGGSGSDKLYGNSGNDKLYGDNGNDRLYGGNGDDELFGQVGNDKMFGGAGNDQLMGWVGNDTFNGGAGWDVALFDMSDPGGNGIVVNLGTGTGTDTFGDTDTFISIEEVRGSDMDDNITGDSGNNSLAGNDGKDILKGQGGDDQLFGGAGNDKLYGGGGNDWLGGAWGNDKLFGGAGNDRLVGWKGNDTFNGGAGWDIAVYDFDDPGSSGIDINLGTGTGTDTFGNTDTFIGIEEVWGSLLDDKITGDSGKNYLWGYDGKDVLKGQGGKDTLEGGAGNDTLWGGAGNDTRRWGGLALWRRRFGYRLI